MHSTCTVRGQQYRFANFRLTSNLAPQLGVGLGGGTGRRAPEESKRVLGRGGGGRGVRGVPRAEAEEALPLRLHKSAHR